MPIVRIAGNGGVFQPDELSALQNVFDQICAQYGIVRQSDKAEAVAEVVITYYQSGLRGEELLRTVALRTAAP